MLVGYFDGGSRGNPGCAGAGWVLYTDQGLHSCGTYYVGPSATNNVSEYHGLLELLAAAVGTGQHESVTLRGDSKLVIEQTLGRWRCRATHLQPLQARAAAALPAEWVLEHVPRAQNQVADALSNLAMDARRTECGGAALLRRCGKKFKNDVPPQDHAADTSAGQGQGRRSRRSAGGGPPPARAGAVVDPGHVDRQHPDRPG